VQQVAQTSYDTLQGINLEQSEARQFNVVGGNIIFSGGALNVNGVSGIANDSNLDIVDLGGAQQDGQMTATGTNGSISKLQTELQQQRDQLNNVLSISNSINFGYKGGKPQAQEKSKEISEEMVNVFGGRLGKIRGLYREQAAAKASGDYQRFNTANGEIAHLYQTLSARSQTALIDINTDALDNIQEAQRQLKSNAQAAGLSNPSAASAGVDHRFDALAAARVTSDWTLTRIPYLDVTLDVDYVYESTPLINQLCYLTASGKNPIRKPLLSGPSAIFVGPDFVGESRIDTTASGAKLRFELGVDREVEIQRQVERVRDTRGLLLHDYKYDYCGEPP
jgi:hypothetical protein